MAINEIKLYRVDGETRAVVGNQEVAPSSVLPGGEVELPEGKWFAPILDLGAKGADGHPPKIGSDGKCQAVYYIEKKKGFSVVEIWFDIYSGTNGFDPGQGTGGYEIEFPEAAAGIIPARNFSFSLHGSLWIKGGQSCWPIELKWSDREFTKPGYVNPKMKLIVFAGGYEWTKVYPRSINEFKLTGSGRYWIASG